MFMKSRRLGFPPCAHSSYIYAIYFRNCPLCFFHALSEITYSLIFTCLLCHPILRKQGMISLCIQITVSEAFSFIMEILADNIFHQNPRTTNFGVFLSLNNYFFKSPSLLKFTYFDRGNSHEKVEEKKVKKVSRF